MISTSNSVVKKSLWNGLKSFIRLTQMSLVIGNKLIYKTQNRALEYQSKSLKLEVNLIRKYLLYVFQTKQNSTAIQFINLLILKLHLTSLALLMIAVCVLR